MPQKLPWKYGDNTETRRGVVGKKPEETDLINILIRKVPNL